MKTTVLHASPKGAADIAKTLLAYTIRRGTPMFERIEITNGFEIKASKTGDIVFRFTNDNGRYKFDYEERLLSFD